MNIESVKVAFKLNTERETKQKALEALVKIAYQNGSQTITVHGIPSIHISIDAKDLISILKKDIEKLDFSIKSLGVV